MSDEDPTYIQRPFIGPPRGMRGALKALDTLFGPTIPEQPLPPRCWYDTDSGVFIPKDGIGSTGKATVGSIVYEEEKTDAVG